MLDVPMFLGQLVGMYLLVIAVILLVRAHYYRELIAHITCTCSVFFAASYTLFIGIALVLLHNVWAWHVDVIITIFAWLMVIKGVLWLMWPDKMLSCSGKCYGGIWYYMMAIIAGIAGLALLSHGTFWYLA